MQEHNEGLKATLQRDVQRSKSDLGLMPVFTSFTAGDKRAIFIHSMCRFFLRLCHFGNRRAWYANRDQPLSIDSVTEVLKEVGVFELGILKLFGISRPE